MPTTETAPSAEDLKRVHRSFVTGVTIVTTSTGGAPRGLAVNAFCSVSLDPPLVLVCVQKTSSTYPSLFAATHFGVNILSVDQSGVARRFATKSADKFSGLAWHEGEAGTPLIDGCSSALVARIGERLEAETHTIFMGRVVQVEHGAAAPMVYSAGGLYDGGRLAPLE